MVRFIGYGSQTQKVGGALSLIFYVNVSLESTVFSYFCWFFSCIPVDERQSAAELDAILQHHHNLQEKLADDMLNLARNLKNNTLAAQNIIKQDNQYIIIQIIIIIVIITLLLLIIIYIYIY
uniref:Vesicle transport protein USE1 n=1 Tax=Sinocyclocheilus anshuiensis TaxID=1608454 RepID=A0A671P7P3_9TELE